MAFRDLLLGGLVAVASLAPGSASAQWTVICPTCTQESFEVIREGRRAIEVAKQIAEAKRQYDQLVQTYQAIRHLPDAALQQLGAQLNVQQFRTPLPTASSAVGSLMNGTGFGNLTGLGQQYLDQNRVYAAPGSDAAAQQLAASAQGVAGVQAMLDQLYQSAAGRIQVLQGIEGQLASAPDAKAVADLSARVQTEQTYLQAQLVQAQTLQTWHASQARSDDLRRQEVRRCYIDAVLGDLQNGTSGVGSGDNCGQASVSGRGVGSSTGGSVQTAAAGTGTGLGGIGAGSSSGQGFVAASYSQYLGQSVGSGQCVALVQAASPEVGLTRTWTQGAQVMGNTSLQPGTAIATFDANGRYANATNGSSHAAIYLGQNERGIQVQDQWLGKPAHVRTIPWNNTTGASNTGSKFYVINH